MARSLRFYALLQCLLAYAITICCGESSTCLTVYREGGAPAVFQSPKCPRWNLPNYGSRPRDAATAMRCQIAMLQGRRKYQEDRTFCALDIRIPFPYNHGLKEVSVGMVAVFDGHNGVEASEMASKLLFEYFILHIYFLLDSKISIALKKHVGGLTKKGEMDAFLQVLNWEEDLTWHELDQERNSRFKTSITLDLDHSFHLKILKEALLRAIQDIDAKFSKEASRWNLNSGSTATVILIADGKVLVANIGDSKALLCSERFQSPSEARATLLRLYREKRRNGSILPVKNNEDFKLATLNGLVHFFAEELTKDHNPDREDERSRVEAAGGYVLDSGGVLRVNGELAVSRAIGDVKLKSYGVIAAPEVRDWQSLNVNDSYLVAASDGVFEKLSPQDVCDILWEAQNHGNARSELPSSCSYSLADCIVDTAYGKGSMDNVATVVVPLQYSGVSENLQQQSSIGGSDTDCTTLGLGYIYEQSGKDTSSDVVQLEYVPPNAAKFDRLMVEPKYGRFCLFYLSEPLSEGLDDIGQGDDWKERTHDLPQALPDARSDQFGGPLNVYTDQNSCTYLGMTNDGMQGKCTNPEGFRRILGLLESISFHDFNSHYESFENAMPNSRYILRKRFGHGSYGEVWLAFHWNCSQGSNSSKWSSETDNASYTTAHSGSFSRYPTNYSFTDDCCSGYNENPFILKRLMVERGLAVYLSGLREKHFGEIFLNASSLLNDLLSAGSEGSFSGELMLDVQTLPKINESVFDDIENGNNYDSRFSNRFTQRAVHEEGLDHIARYVESFESRSNEIWLVFYHEGRSLSKLIYSVVEVKDGEENLEQGKHAQILLPSKWWHWLKTTDAGKQEMRNLIWQLLMAVKACHDRNITHRDIKPENMVICFEDRDTGKCSRGSPSPEKNYIAKMRIIDFGSAIDEFTLKHLYGSSGPSRAEQTSEYAPPEALLNATWYQGPASITVKYDMWSIGVVIVELILGSPNVFQINAVTSALLDQHLEGWDESLKELAYRLRAFMEMCILIPGSSSKYQSKVSPASWKCSEEFFSHQIKSRDPLKLGFPNIWALRLVRRLLQWDPEDRFSVDEALRHPYFDSLPNDDDEDEPSNIPLLPATKDSALLQ